MGADGFLVIQYIYGDDHADDDIVDAHDDAVNAARHVRNDGVHIRQDGILRPLYERVVQIPEYRLCVLVHFGVVCKQLVKLCIRLREIVRRCDDYAFDAGIKLRYYKIQQSRNEQYHKCFRKKYRKSPRQLFAPLHLRVRLVEILRERAEELALEYVHKRQQQIRYHKAPHKGVQYAEKLSQDLEHITQIVQSEIKQYAGSNDDKRRQTPAEVLVIRFNTPLHHFPPCNVLSLFILLSQSNNVNNYSVNFSHNYNNSVYVLCKLNVHIYRRRLAAAYVENCVENV